VRPVGVSLEIRLYGSRGNDWLQCAASGTKVSILPTSSWCAIRTGATQRRRTNCGGEPLVGSSSINKSSAEAYSRVRSGSLLLWVLPSMRRYSSGFIRLRGVGKAKRGLIDPITRKDVGGLNLYNLALSSKLAAYRGRLTIEWGEGYRSWVQLARKKEKTIKEIHRAASEPAFPGFLDFCERLSNLATVPASWRFALSAVAGVYLLTNPDTGKQYVGSAQGEGGFWGRWKQYAASGHGGNRRMQDVPAADYQVSVLEFASSSAKPDEIAKLESRWKQKLLSRKFGLNAN